LIKSIYTDIKAELKLEEAYNPNNEVKPGETRKYSFVRASIESYKGGGYHFIREGTLSKSQDQAGATVIKDEVEFEGWRLIR
jgi:hypothetical protein